MGISFGGLMRGGLPVATQQLMNVPADAAARMDKLEARFKVANSAYKEKEAEVLKKQGTIKNLAKNLGVDFSTNFEQSLWGGHTIFIFKIGHFGGSGQKVQKLAENVILRS